MYVYIERDRYYIYIYMYICMPVALLAEGRLPDARGRGFESQTGQVRGESIPSLWRDKNPAIEGLRPPEHRTGSFIRTRKTPPDQKETNEDATHLLYLRRVYDRKQIPLIVPILDVTVCISLCTFRKHMLMKPTIVVVGIHISIHP